MTVHELKANITEKTSIPPDQQRVLFDGSQLAEGKEIVSYGMRNESTCHQVLRLRGCSCGCTERTPDDYFDVQVETHKGPIVTVSLLGSDSVELLKETVEEAGGLPVRCQRLMIGRETLRAGTTVEDYYFEAGLIVEDVRMVGYRCRVCAPAGGSKFFPIVCHC